MLLLYVKEKVVGKRLNWSMLYILGVSYAFSSIFIIIMIFVCIKWLNSWWIMFLPHLGQPYGLHAYCVCVSVFVESNKMHLCATSVWVLSF